jgi:hypothetical protein
VETSFEQVDSDEIIVTYGDHWVQKLYPPLEREAKRVTRTFLPGEPTEWRGWIMKEVERCFYSPQVVVRKNKCFEMSAAIYKGF